jgi:hypothetical protein
MIRCDIVYDIHYKNSWFQQILSHQWRWRHNTYLLQLYNKINKWLLNFMTTRRHHLHLLKIQILHLFYQLNLIDNYDCVYITDLLVLAFIKTNDNIFYLISLNNDFIFSYYLKYVYSHNYFIKNFFSYSTFNIRLTLHIQIPLISMVSIHTLNIYNSEDMSYSTI